MKKVLELNLFKPEMELEIWTYGAKKVVSWNSRSKLVEKPYYAQF